MKKILALTLAAVMTAGMSTVAFAANEVYPFVGYVPANGTGAASAIPDANEWMFILDEDGDATSTYDNTETGMQLKGGDQLAIPVALWMDGNNDESYTTDEANYWYTRVNALDFNDDISVWGDWVDSEEPEVSQGFVDYDHSALSGRIYSIIITLPENDGTRVETLNGTIKVGTTRNRAKNSDYSFEVEVDYAPARQSVTTIDGNESFDVGDVGIVKFDDDLGEIDLEFGDIAMFTVDVTGQGRLNLSWNTDFDKEFAAMYDYANLDFLTFSGEPSFNRNGYLYIFADEDAFIYEVTAEGAKEIKGLEWSDEYDAWTFRTRKLTSYAISDVELDEQTVTDTDDSSSTTDGGKENPDTGR